MATRHAMLTAAVSVLAMAALLLAGCTPSNAPVHRRHRSASAQSPPAARSKSAQLAAGCHALAGGHGHVVVFSGAHTARRYCAIVWTSDVVHDCPRHAYGAKVIAFLRRHPCGTATRTLATVVYDHLSINLSSVATSFAGTAHNEFGAELKFSQLVASRTRGGIDDLLRAGQRIPGPRGRPTRDAVYGVYSLPPNVDLLYGWYRARPPAGYGAFTIKAIERDVAFTRGLA